LNEGKLRKIAHPSEARPKGQNVLVNSILRTAIAKKQQKRDD
jgi:hypothetical protein